MEKEIKSYLKKKLAEFMFQMISDVKNDFC